MRTSVFRLARDGWLDATAHGRASRYRLTREGARRFDDAHRRIYDAAGRRVGRRLGAGAGRPGFPRARRAALRDELAWAGFGELGAGTFLRPSEPGRPLPSILAAAGVGDRVLVARATDFPGARPLATAADHAWDLGALAADYRRFLQRFGAVIERFRARLAPTIPRSASSCARC